MMIRLRRDIRHRGRVICRGAVLSLEPFEALQLIRAKKATPVFPPVETAIPDTGEKRNYEPCTRR